MTENLIDPIYMTYDKAAKFCRNNVCIECHGILQDVVDRRESIPVYQIRCPRCKKLIREGEYISKSCLERHLNNIALGKRELRDDNRPHKSAEEILKDLGY